MVKKERMPVNAAHEWLNLDRAERQKRIRHFYATNDAASKHGFLSLIKASNKQGVYASIGPHYKYAVFGRDSAEVAEDLLILEPSLVKEIILTLARLQGNELNLVSEEESGKIHHEYRALHFNKGQIPKSARVILQELSAKWGGTEEEMLYYGTYDATPLFVRFVYRYCSMYGTDILDEVVLPHDGRKITVRAAVRQATFWLVSKVTASSWNLFEYKRLNLAGLYNQSWMDSPISYLHKDGTVVNADEGIAAIELQGYAYDALRSAAELIAVNEQEVNALRHLASIVRDNTLERLWLPHKHYFAMGLDRAEDGETRQVESISANAGVLLDSDLFNVMPNHLSWPYVSGIVRMLFSEDFLTPAGLRLRAKSQTHLVSYADYQGSQATWPKETYDIAKGLRSHGFYGLASLLEKTIIHAVETSGEFYEFLFVDRENKVKYHYRVESPDQPTYDELGAVNVPEPGQAWTISAVIAIVDRLHNSSPVLPVADAVGKLEKEILAWPHVAELLKTLKSTPEHHRKKAN